MRKNKIIAVVAVLSLFLVGCDTTGNINNNGSSVGNTTQQDNNSATQNNTSNSGLISEEKAKEIALKHAGLTMDKVRFNYIKQEVDDGREEYNMEFVSNNKEYDYEINAKTGEIISYDVEDPSAEGVGITGGENTPSSEKNVISEAKAKEIAVNHARLSINDVNFIKVRKGVDDGVEEYEIEFIYNNKEYDYEINATSGQIISSDVENIGGRANPTTGNNNEPVVNKTSITEAKAKEIALNHAGLSSNQVKFVKVQKDVDDGIEEYEIEFYYNNKEYNYEINATNGHIVSYEVE